MENKKKLIGFIAGGVLTVVGIIGGVVYAHNKKNNGVTVPEVDVEEIVKK